MNYKIFKDVPEREIKDIIERAEIQLQSTAGEDAIIEANQNAERIKKEIEETMHLDRKILHEPFTI